MQCMRLLWLLISALTKTCIKAVMQTALLHVHIRHQHWGHGNEDWACQAPGAMPELLLDDVLVVDKLLKEHDLPERPLQAVQGASGLSICLCGLRVHVDVHVRWPT